MRVIIAGSRTIIDPHCVRNAIEASGLSISVVLSGCAEGVDRLGEQWAEARGIPVERYPADWKSYGRSAGPRRNQQMVDRADALIAIWDGESRGTRHVIERAKVRGLIVFSSTVGSRQSQT